jgi:hypothetical protein
MFGWLLIMLGERKERQNLEGFYDAWTEKERKERKKR